MEVQRKQVFKCKTTYAEGIVDASVADFTYRHLADNIQWEEGIRSRKGFTRLAKALGPGDDEMVDQLIAAALEELAQYTYTMRGIYLNYYKNGEMWTPNHTHPGTHQLVISIGEPRTLTIAKKDYLMQNGSAAIFGSATHGVPKSDTKEGRISIAVFLEPVSKREN